MGGFGGGVRLGTWEVLTGLAPPPRGGRGSPQEALKQTGTAIGSLWSLEPLSLLAEGARSTGSFAGNKELQLQTGRGTRETSEQTFGAVWTLDSLLLLC